MDTSMLNIYKTKLFDLYDGIWFKKLNYNISFERRKMFLKDGKKNPYFNFAEFEKMIDYNLLYISYIEDCDDEDIDCMSFGFNQLDFNIREKIYKMFLYDNFTATAILRIPEEIKFNENGCKKLCTDEYFKYYVSALDIVNNKIEDYLIGIIYSDHVCLSMFDHKFTDDIVYINNVMKNSEMFLLKTPHYSGYDYVVFYSDNACCRLSEVCSEIEDKLNL